MSAYTHAYLQLPVNADEGFPQAFRLTLGRRHLPRRACTSPSPRRCSPGPAPPLAAARAPGAFLVLAVTREGPGQAQVVFRRKLVPELEYGRPSWPSSFTEMQCRPAQPERAPARSAPGSPPGWRRDGLRDLVPAGGPRGWRRWAAPPARLQRRVQRRRTSSTPTSASSWWPGPRPSSFTATLANLPADVADALKSQHRQRLGAGNPLQATVSLGYFDDPADQGQPGAAGAW